jgi:hypothetical protein
VSYYRIQLPRLTCTGYCVGDLDFASLERKWFFFIAKVSRSFCGDVAAGIETVKTTLDRVRGVATGAARTRRLDVKMRCSPWPCSLTTGLMTDVSEREKAAAGEEGAVGAQSSRTRPLPFLSSGVLCE